MKKRIQDTQFTIRTAKPLQQMLDAIAVERGCDRSDVVRHALMVAVGEFIAEFDERAA